jgi:hypothetical protein
MPNPFTTVGLHAEAYDNSDPRNDGFEYLRTRLNGDSGIKAAREHVKGSRPHCGRKEAQARMQRMLETGDPTAGLERFLQLRATHLLCIAKTL